MRQDQDLPGEITLQATNVGYARNLKFSCSSNKRGGEPVKSISISFLICHFKILSFQHVINLKIINEVYIP